MAALHPVTLLIALNTASSAANRGIGSSTKNIKKVLRFFTICGQEAVIAWNFAFRSKFVYLEDVNQR
jgi:hypothetical protein